MKKIATADYIRQGEWSEVTVKAGLNGWIVEVSSRITGTITGEKSIVPYCEEAPEGADLNSEWNVTMVLGDVIADGYFPLKILRRGSLVR